MRFFMGLDPRKSVKFFTHRYSIIPMIAAVTMMPLSCAGIPVDQSVPEAAEAERIRPDGEDDREFDHDVARDAAEATQERVVPDQPHAREDSGPDEPDTFVDVPEEEPPVVAMADSGAGSPRAPPVRPPRPAREVAIDRILAGMTIEERVGQLFMPAIIADSRGVPRTTVDQEVRHLLATVRPGGIILFGANLKNPEQARRFVRELQEESAVPLIIAVDQEGGLVSRLTSSDGMPATVVPSARRVGLTGDEDLAYQVARATGRELRSLGITMNFAPVADILTNPGNPVIGSRAFGSDPDLVARMVAATVRGLQDSGVSAVVKHFPGHGDTSQDTHVQAVVVPHTLDRLRTVEFPPFASGIAAGADGVMTAHITLPNVTGDYTPSTLSPMVLQDLLRDELAYNGLIITDSLVMGALNSGPSFRDIPVEQLPKRAFQAGADILLYPPAPIPAHRALVEAVRSGEIPEDALNDAVRRVLRVKFMRELMSPPARDREIAEGNPGSDTDERDGAVSLKELFLRPERYFPEELEMGLPEHKLIMDEVLRRSR